MLPRSFRCACGSWDFDITNQTGICPDCAKPRHLSVADALVTDPPYGVMLGSQDHPSGKTEYNTFIDTEENIRDVVIPAIKDAIRLVKRAAITPGTRSSFLYPAAYEMGAIYFPAGSGFSRWGFACFQPILFYGKDPKLITRKEPNSISWTQPADKNGHPCPKPIGLMSWLVGRSTLPNETILDPFMGSGTTLVAAKQLGRKAIGIEIEEKYCEIAATRLRNEPNPLFVEPAPKHCATERELW
jgi:hypothetical protein